MRKILVASSIITVLFLTAGIALADGKSSGSGSPNILKNANAINVDWTTVGQSLSSLAFQAAQPNSTGTCKTASYTPPTSSAQTSFSVYGYGSNNCSKGVASVVISLQSNSLPNATITITDDNAGNMQTDNGCNATITSTFPSSPVTYNVQLNSDTTYCHYSITYN